MADLSDLEPLRNAFADASIVGMGEATHGTREFFRLKHRLLRFMVEEQGLRVFAWEANFSETVLIDEYVTGGDVDVETAIDNIYFWTWDTESVHEMMTWIRSFNEGRPADDQVRVYGFDIQFARGAARRLREYLATVDPEYLEEVRSDLETVASVGVGRESDESVRETAATLADTLAATLTRLEDPFLAIDFTSVDDNVREHWLAGHHDLHLIGAVYDGDWSVSESFRSTVLEEAFDGLVFVEESTATRLVGDEYDSGGEEPTTAQSGTDS